MTEHTYGVLDPAEMAGLDGLATMQYIVAGRFPQATIGAPMRFVLVAVDKGFAAFEGEPDGSLLNPMGSVHGGWALTLIDSATGCACMSLLGPEEAFTTIETKGNLCRAITPKTGLVRCEGRVVAQGRRIITTEAVVRDREQRVLAHGTSTLMVIPRS